MVIYSTGFQEFRELPRDLAMPQVAAQLEMFGRLIAAAIKPGNKSGVQAKAGIPIPAKAAATL